MKKAYFVFIILSILFNSFYAVLSKYTALSIGELSFLAILTNGFYILSLICLGLQALFWQQALIHFKLSYAYPFTALLYFFVLFLSALFFSEHVTFTNIAGLLFISAGISVISGYMGEDQ